MILRILGEHKGYFAGALAPLGAVVMSTFEHIEGSLRLAGLVIGIAVGVMTLIKLHYEINKNKDD